MFAEKGPHKFSIKALAGQCKLPRTNFYYYFEHKDDLIDTIIEFHFESTTQIFNLELENRLHNFIPDLYEVVHEFKIGIQFTKQLFLNREKLEYNKAYLQSVAISSDLIAPKFLEFTKIDIPHESFKPLWYTLTDTWYSRVNFDNYSVDSLCKLSCEIIETILPLTKAHIKQKNKS